MAKLKKLKPVKSNTKEEKKSKTSKSQIELENLSTDGFMSGAFQDSDSDAEQENLVNNSDENGDPEPGDSDQDSDDDLDAEAHAKSLSKLKETDPEFYAFLEENDKKLLNFQINSDNEEEEGQQQASGDEDEEVLHKPDESLHEGSDESDFEGGEVVSERVITLKMVTAWQKALQSPIKVELSTISTVVKAFHAALMTVTAEKSEEKSDFIIKGSGVFNAVVQMCVLYLQPALKKILRLEKSNRDPQKAKRWVKVKGTLKSYFIDMFKLLGGVTSSNILTVLLKHLHQMSPFLGCFPILAKTLFKRLTNLWSTSEETVRVLAFLCILRITRNNQPMLLENVLKMMYMTYVKSSKFISPTTWPNINFMRRSLIEMYALDVNASYQHVFLYIRQLAIHLRNAIVLHKKENIQAVYNWQFVNSMQLWAELLTVTRSKPQLQSLVYPLVMIITNTIKLVPTAQYFPLRFHCVQILLNLSRDADVFIPILPFLLEVLSSHDFGKKHKKVSMKPMSFTCVLRLSKSQLSENGFKDAVIDNVYSLLLESLTIYSHTISFPDIVIPCVIQLKQFLKKCPVANYNKKIRQIVEKIEENSQFLEKERRKISFQLSDIKLINSWETTLKNKGTPLQTYFDNWNKLNTIQKRKRATKNDKLSDALPVIKKAKKDTSAVKDKDDGPVELFPSDSEDETKNDLMKSSDAEMDAEVKPKRKTKKMKRNKKAATVNNTSELDDVPDQDDVVQDFNISDW